MTQHAYVLELMRQGDSATDSPGTTACTVLIAKAASTDHQLQGGEGRLGGGVSEFSREVGYGEVS